MRRRMALVLLTTLWCGGFLACLILMSLKASEHSYGERTIDALKWLFGAFAPVGALISTGLFSTAKLSDRRVDAFNVVLVFGTSLAYTVAIFIVIAMAESATGDQARLELLMKSTFFFTSAQTGLIGALTFFFRPNESMEAEEDTRSSGRN